MTTASPQPSGERRSHISSGMPGHLVAASAMSERAASLAVIAMSTKACIGDESLSCMSLELQISDSLSRHR